MSISKSIRLVLFLAMVTISIPAKAQLPACDFSLSISELPTTACGPGFLENGAIYVTPSSGTPSQFTYQWHNGFGTNAPIIAGRTSSLLFSVGPGIYTVVVTKVSTGCQVIAVGEVKWTPYLPVIEKVIVQSSDLNNNGSAEIVFENNFNNTMIQWNFPSSATTSKITGLGFGTYTASITNLPTGCVQGISVTIGYSEALDSDTIRFLVEPSADCTNPDGAMTVLAVSNTNPQNFSYQWDVNAFEPSTQNSYTNLPDGYHSVLVTNLESGNAVGIGFSIFNNSNPILDIATQDNTLCNGDTNGAAVTYFFDPSATPPFQMDWFQGISLNVNNKISTGIIPPTGNMSPIEDLTAGYYTVQGTNSQGCKTSPVVFPIFDIPRQLNTNVLTTPLASCIVPDGSITLEVSNPGNAGTVFSFFSGNTSNPPIYTGSNNTLTSLTEGLFQIQATDIETGCIITISTSIEDTRSFTVTESTVVDNTNCVDFNGSIEVQDLSRGSLQDYSIQWFMGTDPNPVAVNTPGLNSLTPGQYTARIINLLTACQLDEVFQVLDNKQLPTFDIEITNNTNCQNFNGAAEVSNVSSEQLAEHAFFWYEGSTVSDNPINETSDADLENLGVGTYTLVIENNDTQCEQIQVILILDETVIPEISTVTVNDGICDQQGGILEVTAVSTGILADYTFTWYQGNTTEVANLISGVDGPILSELASGNYTVVATHAISHCTSTPIIETVNCITGLDESVDISIFPNPATSMLSIKLSGEKFASATLIDALGRPVIIRKFTGETTLDVTQLSKGVYFIKIENGSAGFKKQIIIR